MSDSKTTRIALLIEYSGKHFHGSQYQGGVRTVQDELEKAFAVLTRDTSSRVSLSGRTDAGVSAAGQVAHVDLLEEPLSPDRISDLIWRLNGVLASDLSVTRIDNVPESFHARRSARAREYVYRILNKPQRSALLKDTHLHVRQPLDLAPMQEAAACLLGRHDFSAFRSTSRNPPGEIASPDCLVSRSEILNLREGVLEFWICADHFVYNMVRIIVGTLIDIGLGKRGADCVSRALEEQDRTLTGPTAPPWGLTLNAVRYPGFSLWSSGNQSTVEEIRSENLLP